MTSLKLGTRGSPLAVAQAEQAKAELLSLSDDGPKPSEVEIVTIQTTGDQVLDRPLAEIGGKGLFSKELDRAQLDHRVDFAVHSMKDLETWMPDGVVIAAVLPREDPRDVFLSASGKTLDEMPEGSVIGTSSVRRQAQILDRRPDLKVTLFRGNVQTRLKKLQDGVADATMLALAGLNRLGMSDKATAVLEPEQMLPAVSQGAIGITCRADDAATQAILARLNCTETMIRVTAERAMLEALDGSCRTPIAGLAELTGDRIRLRGLVAREDGSEVLRHEAEGDASDARDLGLEVGRVLKDRAGPGFFEDHA